MHQGRRDRHEKKRRKQGHIFYATGLVTMLYKVIKHFFRKFNNFIRRIKCKTINIVQLLLSKKENIISYEKHGESIFQWKDKSVERIFFPKVYSLAEESWVDFYFPKIEVRKFIDAQVYSASDFIITKDGAVWEKYFKPQWAKIIPKDNELVKLKDQYIFIRKPKHIKTIDYGFSLCGVHSTVWAHFLVQYLPKLYLLNDIQLIVNHDLTIILPSYKDLQIREIVYAYLSHLKNIKIVELGCNDAAQCKVLYLIESTAYISDHANYINPSDIIIPRFTIDLLKNNLVNIFANNFEYIKDGIRLPFRKLYIGRSGQRNVFNNVEIEEYFVSQGFEVLQPHDLTLMEKVKIFREAAVIVGPFSSGFTNILFCQPGTKALAFTNYQRIFDGYINTFGKYFEVDIMFVTGYDQDQSIHSSYVVPIDKIKLAYLKLIS